MAKVQFGKGVEISDKYDSFIDGVFKKLTSNEVSDIIADINRTFGTDYSGTDLYDVLVELSEDDIIPFSESVSFYLQEDTYNFLCSVVDKEVVDQYLNFGELASMLSEVASMELIASCDGESRFGNSLL